MSSLDSLFSFDPFDMNNSAKEAFIKSFRECAKIHINGNSYINFLWKEAGFDPSMIVDEKSLELAPFTMINLFKEQELCTGDKGKIILTLGSSGTSGQRSLIHLNQESLERVKKLAFDVYSSLNITSQKKYNYLCFTYDPKIANDLGTAFTDELLTSFTQINDVYYAIEFDESIQDFKLNERKVVEKLKEFETNGFSTRILGFPSFLYKIIKDYDINLDLGEDSWVQIGGGWKNHEGEKIPKSEFRDFVSTRLGLPKENIRDLFGMVEHGIPYVDDERGNLRIPNYSRVYIRDPKTLKVLPDGKEGLIQFMCSYNTSYPSFNILTNDIGYKKPLGQGQYALEIVGRGGKLKSKGCALKANELLRS